MLRVYIRLSSTKSTHTNQYGSIDNIHKNNKDLQIILIGYDLQIQSEIPISYKLLTANLYHLSNEIITTVTGEHPETKG